MLEIVVTTTLFHCVGEILRIFPVVSLYVHVFRRPTHLQGTWEACPLCFSRMILLTCAARTSLAFQDHGKRRGMFKFLTHGNPFEESGVTDLLRER